MLDSLRMHSNLGDNSVMNEAGVHCFAPTIIVISGFVRGEPTPVIEKYGPNLQSMKSFNLLHQISSFARLIVARPNVRKDDRRREQHYSREARKRFQNNRHVLCTFTRSLAICNRGPADCKGVVTIHGH